VLEGVLFGLYDIGIADHKPDKPRLDGDLIGADELCLLLSADEADDPSYADLERLGFIAIPTVSPMQTNFCRQISLRTIKVSICFAFAASSIRSDRSRNRPPAGSIPILATRRFAA